MHPADLRAIPGVMEVKDAARLPKMPIVEHADQQEHRGKGSVQGQQEVEPEPDVLLPEGEGDAVRKVGEAAGHEGVVNVPDLLDGLGIWTRNRQDNL